MENKGLTISMIVEGESLNYGEGIGNVTTLKRISRDGGRSYSYVSRQALRFNIIKQMKEDITTLALDGDVLQFHPDAKIDEYAEIDLFGYMKTKKPVKTRAAVVRLSNAVALETFNSDLDFLTNKGLLDRYNEVSSKKKEGGNIAQSEIHKSYYTYTITIDLDKVGIDINDKIEISNSEKENRIKRLLKAIKFLYRDIKGRRENLSPVFAIGGVYSIKNPFFENRIKVFNNRLNVEVIESVLKLDKEIRGNTIIGKIDNLFINNKEIEEKLNSIEIGEFFEKIEKEIESYYSEK
ncbi:MAG: type I-B CRISPR-associated protein Cas7/Cst2/DevR [Clostridium sp.]|uniref:type I-B CRISPR-associated protein Cas7/Cst2/DevR n=1 Tax=Clostridium sp. TaxID=1506 RepID=UPI003F2A2066